MTLTMNFFFYNLNYLHNHICHAILNTFWRMKYFLWTAMRLWWPWWSFIWEYYVWVGHDKKSDFILSPLEVCELVLKLATETEYWIISSPAYIFKYFFYAPLFCTFLIHLNLHLMIGGHSNGQFDILRNELRCEIW